ncbi:MAG: hypothetical protein JWR60_4321 [Polaromonas sp.]|nr:hypothetical protein [Polaromonas sp.]
MQLDPITNITDMPLVISASVISQLKKFRQEPKVAGLPGIDPEPERERLSRVVNQLVDTLLIGLPANSSKLWALKQFQVTLEAVQYEDTEGREHFGLEIERIMDILGIQSSDGLLSFYL